MTLNKSQSFSFVLKMILWWYIRIWINLTLFCNFYRTSKFHIIVNAIKIKIISTTINKIKILGLLSIWSTLLKTFLFSVTFQAWLLYEVFFLYSSTPYEIVTLFLCLIIWTSIKFSLVVFFLTGSVHMTLQTTISINIFQSTWDS